MQGIKVLLDTLRAVAQEGLFYSQNDYDTARYQKLLEMASKEYAAITGLRQEEIQKMFLKEQGSITPKVGVDAAVVNDHGEILVLQRQDNGAWGVPGGWADVDESPLETAIRETHEETGLSIEPVGYIGIASKTPRTYPGWMAGWASQVNICAAVKPIAADTKITVSHEHTAYKWIKNVEQIDTWNAAHKPLVERAFVAYREKLIIPQMENH